ncbi:MULTISPECIES: hypothetical protein [Symbiopectobacterium]|uniref:hypothetical protein n=1 Tax=Symbiopectobacterium TaxID=801 RepID=UPI00207AB0BE|nr:MULTISPECIES: hypothetical protein [Symbiopectobacterium]MBT9429429.1 hypothetical protein [Candidatus Symbiopectobacterium endolongispinus]
MMDGTAITVGVIEVPETFGKLYSSSGFVEEYSQGDDQLSSCYVMGTQSSTFLNPIGDDTTTARQSTNTYGNCNDLYVVQAACNDQACINNVSDLGAIASPYAPTVAIVNNNDLTAKSISNELSKANLVVIHSMDGAWAPNVYFPSPRTFKWKSIFVNHNATNGSYFQINGAAKKIDKGGLDMYISDGNRWNIINPR